MWGKRSFDIMLFMFCVETISLELKLMDGPQFVLIQKSF